jgi:hypothetical protein
VQRVIRKLSLGLPVEPLEESVGRIVRRLPLSM